MPLLKFLVNLIKMTTLSYVLVCISLFALQRSLIYYPQPSQINTPGSSLKIPITEGELHISVRQSNSPKALIYFGGNAEDVSLNLPNFSQAFPDYAIYLLHYRGYGQSSGAPSEQVIQQDALALFDQVYAKQKDITIIGRSLGSGVAVQVASQRPASKLILITPYDSLEEVAAFHYPYIPVSLLLLDKYESWRYAPQIAIPTLILAAEQDNVIPRANTEKLYSHFKNGLALFKVLANTNHGTISQSSQYLPLLTGFMKKIDGINNQRR
jgi:pimeloyl-ACP methyl ester carboxylesterase